jgi:hypothetical protein
MRNHTGQTRQKYLKFEDIAIQYIPQTLWVFHIEADRAIAPELLLTSLDV